MSAGAGRAAPVARRRLLGLLGIERHALRGRFAPARSAPDPIPGAPIVLVDRPDVATHPLLRAILAALAVDPAAVRVDGARIPDGARVLMAFGARDAAAAAEVAVPALAELARDPAAKRALWRSLRPLLRHT